MEPLFTVYLPGEIEPVTRDILERESAKSTRLRITLGDEAPPDFHVLVSGTPERALLESTPSLRHLVIPWAGLPGRTRTLMLEFPRISVFNLHHNAAPTAEMALSLLLAAATRIVPCDRSLRAGDWTPRYDEECTSTLLAGKHATILGYGAVGRRIAQMCQALEMSVVAFSRRGPEGRAGNSHAPHPALLHRALSRADLRRELARTDVLLVALPLTPETKGLLDLEALSCLPSQSLVVNIARAAIFDEEALYDALRNRRIRAAGLDVWWKYPEGEGVTNTRPSNFPFEELDHVVMSPHRAAHCEETPVQMGRELARLLVDLSRGDTSRNVVDVARGY